MKIQLTVLLLTFLSLQWTPQGNSQSTSISASVAESSSEYIAASEAASSSMTESSTVSTMMKNNAASMTSVPPVTPSQAPLTSMSGSSSHYVPNAMTSTPHVTPSKAPPTSMSGSSSHYVPKAMTSIPHVTPSPTPSTSMSSSSSSYIPSPTQPGSNKFTFSFKIENYQCSNAIKENIVGDSMYKSLVTNITAAVAKAYVSDPTYKSAKVLRFECGSVIPTVEVTKSVYANGTAAAELNLVKTVVDSGTFAGYTVNSFSSKPAAAASLPSLYFILKTGLSNKQLCHNRESFKKSLASIVVASNGESFIQPSQIVFVEHKCNDQSAATKRASPKVYIATSALDVNKMDTEITTRVHRLITQFIDDGTTWRLSAAFDGKVTSSTLGGTAKPKDEKLSELSRVGIGMGVTFAVLILVIAIILISAKFRNTDGAVTMGNPIYMEDETQPAEDNGGYTHETKVQIGDNEYEYPSGPVNGKVEQETYQDLQQTNQSQQPTYEPLSAVEENKIRVEVEPENHVTVTSPKQHNLSLDELSHRKDNDEEMRQEFEGLEYDTPSSDVYSPGALEKNRLLNSVPRPETRVVLSTLSDQPNSDYINANYVKDHNQKKRYILTQAPLEKTAEDFWRMIQEQGVHVIVMVTPLVQLGAEKCHQYWPADSAPRRYGDLEIQLKKKELKPDFTITTMSLKTKDETRDVILYRYMTWPEDNIPENVKTFVTFLLAAKNACGSADGQMLVVHCSDGVSISASFVAVDIGIESLQENRSVDVFSIVKGIRKDRAGALPMFGQYKFIYRALHEYVIHHDENAYANPADTTSSM